MSEGSEEEVNYKPGEKVDINTLVNQDNEDESLRKYKEALLGNVAEIYAPKDDPRRVVVTELKVMLPDRPGGDITYNLEEKGGIEKLKSEAFTIKESAKFKIQVRFKVQHEIVSGLKYENKIYKGIVKGQKLSLYSSLIYYKKIFYKLGKYFSIFPKYPNFLLKPF